MSFRFRRRPEQDNNSGQHTQDPYFDPNQNYQDLSAQPFVNFHGNVDGGYINNQQNSPQMFNQPFYSHPLNQNLASQTHNSSELDKRFFNNGRQEFDNGYVQQNFNLDQQLNPYLRSFQTNQLSKNHGVDYRYSHDSDLRKNINKPVNYMPGNNYNAPSGFDDVENNYSSPVKLMVSVAGVAILVAISWFAYRWVKDPYSNDNPPLIHAAEGSHKVRPDHRGGVNIPYQDKLIYNRISDDDQPVERILPEQDENYSQEEEYIADNDFDKYQEGIGSVNQNVNNSHVKKQQNYLLEEESESGNISENSNLDNYRDKESLQKNKIQESERQVKVLENKGKMLDEEELQKPSTTIKGNFFVQLATLKSEASALKEWKRFQHKYGLNNQKSQIKEFETVDGETVYRLLMGPFDDKVKALKHAVKIDGSKIIQVTD